MQMGMKEDSDEVTVKTRILSLELLQVFLNLCFDAACFLCYFTGIITKYQLHSQCHLTYLISTVVWHACSFLCEECSWINTLASIVHFDDRPIESTSNVMCKSGFFFLS